MMIQGQKQAGLMVIHLCLGSRSTPAGPLSGWEVGRLGWPVWDGKFWGGTVKGVFASDVGKELWGAVFLDW